MHLDGKCRCASKSLVALDMPNWGRDGVFVDLGCGDSADGMIARKFGQYAFGVDLFEPSPMTDWEDYLHPPQIFLKGDICERIPLSDGFVLHAVCHAVIDLIPPDCRLKFFEEVTRILASDGLFALSPARLQQGYGYTHRELVALARQAGMERCPYRDQSVLLFHGKPFQK
jgi:SAM-dependent methyltransferase